MISAKSWRDSADRVNSYLGEHFNLVVGVVCGAILIAFIALVVWDAQPISGTVKDKVFTAAHNEVYFTQSCTTTHVGEQTFTNCISTPHNRWVNDRWMISVCDETRCKWIELSHIRYDDIHIDDHFSEK